MSTTSIQEFEREYLRAMQEDCAAIFAGAGLSRASGYVNWKELLKEFASDINLKVEKEDDLVSLAQYYFNKQGGNRNLISRKIVDEFTKETSQNENLEILSSLPLDTYWTTNYDSLIEDALEKYANRKADVKRSKEDLAITLAKRDAVVYKMHGDVTRAHEAVLIKDDYESYNEKRQLFTTSLQGDLVSKTFLFIGFSFEDPNLTYILSRIRVLIGQEHNRMHYCFIRKINRSDYSDNPEGESDYVYDKTKQELRIQDLMRYGIYAVMVKEYSDITGSLKRIQFKHKLNNILISGSAEEYGAFEKEDAEEFMFSLSNRLIQRNFKLITGFGKGVGTYVVSGALEEIYKNKFGRVSSFLITRPFPYVHKGVTDRAKIGTKYRNTIIDECGVVVFIFGNKRDTSTGELIDAGGVIEEFKIAKNKGKVIIPVGSTGYAAKAIWDEVNNNLEKFEYLRDSIETLVTERDSEKVFAEISKIVSLVKGV